MVSLAAFPKCWIEQIVEGKIKLEDWIDTSVDLQCDGLEMYSKFLSSHERGYLQGIRRRVENHGMKIPMLCYAPDFTVPDKDELRREIERQKEMIRVTAELGGGFCRTLSGQKRSGLAIKEGIAQVVYSIGECLREAEKNDVVMVIENHYKDSYWEYPEFAQKMEIFLEIVNRIDSPWFGVQFDPSNAIVAGEDPLELLDQVVGRVGTVHASDRFLKEGATLKELDQADGSTGYSENLCHGVIGKGLNDYEGIFSRLKANGFDGWISIEDGMNGFEEMKESLSFLKSMCAKYFGY
jgi:sugar phosphate isomerase/epimerase